MDIDEKSRWIMATPNEFGVTLPFICSEAGDFLAGKSFYTERDYKNSYWLVYTLQGEGVLTQGNHVINLQKGSCVLIDCKSYQKYETAPNCDLWHHYWVHISGTGVSSIFPIINTGQPIILNPNSYEIKAFFDTIFNNANQNTVAQNLSVSMAVHSALHMLCTLRIGSNAVISQRQSDILEIADYIRENYREPLQVEALSKKIHLSKFYFIKLFRRYLGTTPYDYLLNYRINKAKELLCSTRWSIGDIGLYVGFTGESNFTAQFTRIVAISPLKYRKEHYTIEKFED